MHLPNSPKWHESCTQAGGNIWHRRLPNPLSRPFWKDLGETFMHLYVPVRES